MSSDLLSIGSSGVQAQQKLLWTTGNNISNINTEGYTRQRTELYTNVASLGVGMSNTERMLNVYAQREMWRDTSSLAMYTSAYEQLASTDQYLSSSANSLNSAMSSYFSAFDTANANPNTSSSRQGLMSSVSSLVTRFQTASTTLSQQQNTINGSIESEVKEINSLLSGISDLNAQIIKAPKNSDGTTLNLIDQRDEMIRKLSEKMDIRTVAQDNGSTLVNLSTGQSLVLASGAASLGVTKGNPDNSQTGLQLTIGTSSASLSTSQVGGGLGGLYQARQELAPLQNEIGQLAVALADAMNQQNSQGMTLNNQLGGDIFTLPTSQGLANANNGGTGAISVSFIPGKGSNVSANDFEVKFTSATDFEVYRLDGNSKTLLTNGSTPPNQFPLEDYGIQLDISGTPAAGDSIVLQPTRNAAQNLSVAITSTDDFALAAPVTGSADSNNYGNGTISLAGVYNTGTGSLINSSSLDATAPQQVKIDASGNYEVYDGSGNLLGVADASTKGQNLLANLKDTATGSLIYSDVKTTPGFDFSISGTVSANDSFTIRFNTDGINDNYNGLALADLQNQDLVRKGSSVSADSQQTFSEAFSSTLSSLGSTVSSLNTSMSAAEAKLTQSTNTYNSEAGVSLDEEAANLIRFQQAYAASAQIITAARAVFDSLLSAAR
ncbi:flagellar hook-associated protein FlgK [Pseudaeromonas sharmana]|uniref:Flagellar hook-associated protein 1 n=1 Tax=Pseudaeromonas sharmana TaxID=328412 RepID=A0ABV8CJ56_9GAMM